MRPTEPLAVLNKYVLCEAVVRAVAGLNTVVQLPLTTGNVESVLDEVRPYLIADGGDVALHEINGNVVRLKLQGACGSCPSSVTTMKMSIQRRLMENIPEISAVERVADKEMGLKLNEANVQKVFTNVQALFSFIILNESCKHTSR
jgi:Fe-S cluster biogenesis protein NfuA